MSLEPGPGIKRHTNHLRIRIGPQVQIPYGAAYVQILVLRIRILRDSGQNTGHAQEKGENDSLKHKMLSNPKMLDVGVFAMRAEVHQRKLRSAALRLHRHNVLVLVGADFQLDVVPG